MIGRLLLLGLIIGSNNLAAALTLGALGQRERRTRIVVVFACFEFLIPLVGIWLGRRAAGNIGEHMGWLGSVLLSALGLWALWSAFAATRRDEALAARVTSWGGLVLLAVGLSMDNLIIGFSLGLAGTEPLAVAGTIAAFSATFTWVGITAGAEARRHWERWAKAGAATLLLGLAAASWAGWL